jgi:hypothetical protein
LSIESAEYLDRTSRGVFVQCTVEEGKSILEKILSITPLEDMQPRAHELSKDVLIITYPDASDIPTSPARAELLQLTASELGSNEEIEDNTPSHLSIEEDLFDDDVGDMSKVPTYDIKNLNVEPVEQDLEEFMVAQENLLDLSALISRDWIEALEEDDSYIKVYPEPKINCCCLQGFMFHKACYDSRVGVNLLLVDEASDIDMQSLIPSTKILQWQLGLNLQCKGVVPMITEIEDTKVCLEYHIFYKLGPTFILIGVSLHALLRGVVNGESLKLAIGHKEFSTSFSRTTNHAAEQELEKDPLQQVMAATLEEELLPPGLDDAANYFTPVDEEVEFQNLEQEAKLEASPIELKQLPLGLKYVFLNGNQTSPVIISDKLTNDETQKLATTLEKYQLVIDYSLTDLKGIGPSFCTHRIPTEQDHMSGSINADLILRRGK